MDVFENGNAILQPLLDQRGVIAIRQQGTYILHKPLIIHSHTHLRLAPGVVIQAGPLARCCLLENDAFYGEGHNQDVEISGGLWDGNCDAQEMDIVPYSYCPKRSPHNPHLFTGKMIRLAHVDNLSMHDIALKDSVSYGIQVGDVTNFQISDIHCDYNCHFGTSDGVHINGPASNGTLTRIHGMTNDDLVSLTTVDWSHGEITRGPISNIVIDDIHSGNGYSGVRLLANGHPMTDIAVRNITGTYRVDPVCITHHNIHPDESIWMDNILVEGVYASKSDEEMPENCHGTTFFAQTLNDHGVVWVADGMQIGNLTIRDVNRVEKTTSLAPTIRIDPNVSIKRLTIQNIRQHFTCGQQLPLLDNQGTIEDLIELG